MNLYLIGYRGTGKSTVAAELARRLGRTTVDADIELERQAGKTIAAIFAEEGEQAFRDLEATVLFELAARREQALIVAVGGGGILRREDREQLAGSGQTVWLQASAETIHQRVSGDPTTAERRPNLTTSGGLDEIRALLAQREEIYRSLADVQVDTESKNPAQIADEIIRRLALSDTVQDAPS